MLEQTQDQTCTVTLIKLGNDDSRMSLHTSLQQSLPMFQTNSVLEVVPPLCWMTEMTLKGDIKNSCLKVICVNHWSMVITTDRQLGKKQRIRDPRMFNPKGNRWMDR